MKPALTTLFISSVFAAMSGLTVFAQSETLPDFDTALADTENWREVAPGNLIVFDIRTANGADRGKVYIETAAFAAPNHVEQFLKVVQSGDYNGTIFHRVIEGFMAQGGDVKRYKPESDWPNINQEFVFTRKPGSVEAGMPSVHLLGQNSGGLEGYAKGFPMKTQSEFLASYTTEGTVESWILHCPGTVSTARTDDPNSASTQFFLMRDTSEFLDKRYTPWGRIVVGLDVVRSIEKGDAETGEVDRPDILLRATLASDLDEAVRPKVLVQRVDGPEFQSFLTSATERSVCALPPVPAILKE